MGNEKFRCSWPNRANQFKNKDLKNHLQVSNGGQIQVVTIKIFRFEVVATVLPITKQIIMMQSDIV